MDTDALLQKIHRLIELNVDYPSSGDDDYELRFGLLNDHIGAWESEEGTLWDELWTLASFTSTSASSYTLSAVSPAITNFRFPGGFVELVDSNGGSVYWEVLKPEEVRLRSGNVTDWDYQYMGTNTRWCYFLGNPQAGFTLYFNPNFLPGAGTIKFPYYRQATLMTTGSDKPEMSDTDYLVHSVVSDVLAQDDIGESDKHLQIAQSVLRGMKTLNAMKAPWMKNRVEDRAGTVKGAGFGR